MTKSSGIGYADTMHGINTFSPNGDSATLEEWRIRMLKACEVCRDREYAKGVLKALATISPAKTS
jgi:hypothetical protein